MELIRKSDAMHAVLHNQGDAAVTAVQSIQPLAIVTNPIRIQSESDEGVAEAMAEQWGGDAE